MSSLQDFLLSAKTKKDYARIVVLGNEAADLDSMVSAITYGYLLSRKDSATVVLPLMPIPRADFKLRTEAVYVFEEAGIDLDSVTFFDEVDFDKLMDSGAGLVLVDHNRLCPSLDRYGSQVTAVLDHHVDEGLYGEASPRIIQQIGSTTTLVGMAYMAAGTGISESIAILLCGTILLDTVNLAQKAGRVTDDDISVAETLLPLCPLIADEFFDNIQREKCNITGLSTRELLRKDYKEFVFSGLRCGISSARLSIQQWQEIDSDIFSSFADFAVLRGLDVLLSMNAFTDPDFSRDMVVYCTTRERHDALILCLQNNFLGLVPRVCSGMENNNRGSISCYRQGNLGISRKKLQPLLAELYK